MQVYTKVGKINSSHGLKGELQVSHWLQTAADMNAWTAIMIELHPQSYIPYFIQQVKHTTSQDCIIKLEDIDSPEQARDLANCNIYASPLIAIPALIKNDWDALIGYVVKDVNEGVLGQIQDISKGVGQEFLHVLYNGKDIMIPIQDAWITGVHAASKTIEMHLPNGYLEAFG
jgi:16S rRNA processing protein RimM